MVSAPSSSTKPSKKSKKEIEEEVDTPGDLDYKVSQLAEWVVESH